MPIAGQYTGSLSNGGERIGLKDAVGQVIADFRYHDEWYPASDGRGRSLEVRAPASLSDLSGADAWQVSRQVGGTPGMPAGN